jgi:hypothetical protein
VPAHPCSAPHLALFTPLRPSITSASAIFHPSTSTTLHPKYLSRRFPSLSTNTTHAPLRLQKHHSLQCTPQSTTKPPPPLFVDQNSTQTYSIYYIAVMAAPPSPHPVIRDPIPTSRRNSSRKTIPCLSRTASNVDAPRTVCPKDGDAFSYDPSHLRHWNCPQELWDRLPKQVQASLTDVQHAGAAVLTGKSNHSACKSSDTNRNRLRASRPAL